MKAYYSIIICLSIIFCSCGGQRGGEDKSSSRGTAVERAIQASEDQLELLELYLQQYRQSQTDDNLLTVVHQMDKCEFSYDDSRCSVEEKKLCVRQKIKADAAMQSALNLVQDAASRLRTDVVKKEDYLMDKGVEAFPFYAQKGDRVFFSLSSAQRFTVKLYNADSRTLLKTYQGRTNLVDSMTVSNSAIYLLEVIPTANQYMDLNLQQSTLDLSSIGKVKSVKTEEIDAARNDFRARAVKGVSMSNMFEEPRKFTLRGQFKAAFSGSARALVALQVPAGATDVLYSLRISTNEGDHTEDGDFCRNMSHSYHKIKFLGLPLYESTRGSGLIAQLLGDNVPLREEDAYINMFVFFDAAQARLFQDGKPTSELKYHVDYSTLGTQSCNGRIPASGRKTIYLAFENERVRFNNYVWLEAVSCVPTTEYVTEKYSLTDAE